ncbi:MAG: DUF6102 family protein [Eubacterium sp.]
MGILELFTFLVTKISPDFISAITTLVNDFGIDTTIEWVNLETGLVSSSLVSLIMYPEKNPILGSVQSMWASISTQIFMAGMALIIVKVAFKGFMTYIIQDNDPDSSPAQLFVKMIQATAVAVGFTEVLYPLLFLFTSAMTQLIIRGANESVNGISFTTIIMAFTSPLPTLIYVGAFIIVKGFQLWILRCGFPIACIGIINSDYGVFQPYMKKFIQLSFEIIIQIGLMYMSFLLVIQEHPNFIYAMAALVAAFSAPKILQEFLLFGNSGSGIGNKMYGGIRAADMMRSLIK